MTAIGMKPSAAIGTIPAYYKGNPRSVIGTDDEVVAPSYAETLDFEMEIGLYLKRQGKNIPISEAASYIGGYTIFNDASARVRQADEMAVGIGPAKGKDFDTGNVMGPCLVPDLDLNAVRYTVRVNGEEWTSGTVGELHWSVEEVISYISTSETLYPGDFIGLGTVPGGCGLELGRYPKLGDVVELEAAPIGILRCAYARRRDPGVTG
jgi:2-keto-4-pentenoate hydratase/2-oxohepta-3-ene-1,7-dioic acid hydratase in catechol pathway